MLYIFVELIYKLLVTLVFNMASTYICLILGLRVPFKSCFTAAMQPIKIYLILLMLCLIVQIRHEHCYLYTFVVVNFMSSYQYFNVFPKFETRESRCMLNQILPNTNGIPLPYSGEISLVIRLTSSKN